MHMTRKYKIRQFEYSNTKQFINYIFKSLSSRIVVQMIKQLVLMMFEIHFVSQIQTPHFKFTVLKFKINTLELNRIMFEAELPMVEEPEVAGFVVKTFQILKNEEFSRIIYWGANGKQFVIKDITKFQEMVLPKYFRHKKINSFIRQLNMYGFHKSRRENTKSIFSHPYFIKDREDLLKSIKRKVRLNSGDPSTPVKNIKNDEQGHIDSQKYASSNQICASQKKQDSNLDNTAFKNFNTPSTIKESLSFRNQSQAYDMNVREFLDSRQCLQSRMNLNFINCTSLNKVSQNFLDDIIDNVGGGYQYNEKDEKDEILSIENGINQENLNRMNEFQENKAELFGKNKGRKNEFKANLAQQNSIRVNQNGANTSNTALKLNIVIDGPSHFLLPTKDEQNK